VDELDRKTRELTSDHATSEALFTMGELAEQVDRIFNETLVNDPDDPKTAERLRLLSYGASCMLRIGDFTKIA
jgi:glycyl-tRNA synthetase beta chain